MVDGIAGGADGGRWSEGRQEKLIPQSWRPWLPWALLAVGAWIAAIGLVVRQSWRPLPEEGRIDAWLAHSSGWVRQLAGVLAGLGPAEFAALLVLVVIGLVIAGDVLAAGVTGAGVSLQLILVELVLKPFFGRHLAGASAASYPSGHASAAAALAMGVLLALAPARPLGRWLGRLLRRAVIAASWALAAAVGLAMVVHQAHYLSDVLAGAPFGAGVTVTVALLADRRSAYRGARSPAEGADLPLAYGSADVDSSSRK